uniref:Uncharacterized protein n=1 Tax=viral metagenome TaxID=1070528 RepID=A0A6M3M789_9ZZZZ
MKNIDSLISNEIIDILTSLRSQNIGYPPEWMLVNDHIFLPIRELIHDIILGYEKHDI